jgi:hypothetical protein
MNLEWYFGFLIGGMFLSSIALGQVTGQDNRSTDPAVTYAQTARELLNQTMNEYSEGNSTGAEELATRAYLDNFEHVEAPLEVRGAGDLMHELEGMMREELRGMIKDNASVEEVGMHINATDAKLSEAISILTAAPSK